MARPVPFFFGSFARRIGLWVRVLIGCLLLSQTVAAAEACMVTGCGEARTTCQWLAEGGCQSGCLQPSLTAACDENAQNSPLVPTGAGDAIVASPAGFAPAVYAAPLPAVGGSLRGSPPLHIRFCRLLN